MSTKTPKEIIADALAHCPTEQGVDDIVAQIIIDRLKAEGWNIVAADTFITSSTDEGNAR